MPRLDETVLAGLSTIGGEDTAFVTRMVDLFETNSSPAVERITAAAEGAANLELAEAVHALKSMASNIGAARLAATCSNFERRARDGETIDPAEVCRSVSDELSAALGELRQRFKAA